MTLILLVEDDLLNREMIGRYLQLQGFEVITAVDGAQAVERAQSQLPDLILMDINMPDMDGYTLTATIKAMPGFERTPILALTANVMRGDKEKTLEAGCDGYIQKPLDIDQLIREVERFLLRRTNA